MAESIAASVASPPRGDRAALVEVLLLAAALSVLNWDAWLIWPEPARVERATRIGAALVILLTLIVAYWRRRPGLAESGFAPPALGRGWLTVVLFSAGSVALLALLGLSWGEPSLALVRSGWLRIYVLGVVGQQLVLQLFVNDRFFRAGAGLAPLARLRFTVVSSALLFAALHAPNPWLVVVTFPAAIFWSWHFRRHFNLPALMASQFVVGTAAMVLLGEGALLHLRVGWGALRMMLES